jgi:PAS domain S-box-containing protein
MTEVAAPGRGDVVDEAFLRAIVDHVPEALLVTTQDGVVTFVNQASEALFGYQAADIIGLGVAALIPPSPERRADPVKWLARWAAEPQPEHARWLDFLARRSDGREMPVDVRVAQAEVAGELRFFITVRDNTVLRQEQATAREASLRAARILLVAEDAIVTCDASQRITFFNLKAEEVFGYGAQEVIGEPLTHLLPEAARAVHPDHVADFGAGALPSRMMSQRQEVRGLRRNGDEFPIEATITKVAVDGVLTFTAHVRDISERKAAQAALAESERRFHAMFDHAFGAIALLDPLGIVLEINRAARALTVGAEPLIGRPLWDLPWLGGAGVAPDAAAQDRLKQAIAVAASGVATRYTAELRDGPLLRKIDLSLTPITDESGDVVYILPEGREVTGRSF